MLDPATRALLAALRDPHPSDPIILANLNLFDFDPLSSMRFGLQIPDAWRDTIVRLCQRLQPLAADARAQGIDFQILSAKEKFGTLRISYRGGTPEIEAEIEWAKGEVFHA